MFSQAERSNTLLIRKELIDMERDTYVTGEHPASKDVVKNHFGQEMIVKFASGRFISFRDETFADVPCHNFSLVRRG